MGTIADWYLRGSIKRRHIAVSTFSMHAHYMTRHLSKIFFVEATAVDTLQNQFSGYGSTTQTIARTLDKLSLKEPLEAWSNETISLVVNAFTDEKFPTVIALKYLSLFPSPLPIFSHYKLTCPLLIQQN